jgi:hypothetical protein
MVESNTELRFYGCGQGIWYNATPNGGTWNGYVSTNVTGGDPSVLKVASGSYLMVYVGQPYSTDVTAQEDLSIQINISTDQGLIHFQFPDPEKIMGAYITLYNCVGQKVGETTINSSHTTLEAMKTEPGIYFYRISRGSQLFKNGKIVLK